MNESESLREGFIATQCSGVAEGIFLLSGVWEYEFALNDSFLLLVAVVVLRLHDVAAELLY